MELKHVFKSFDGKAVLSDVSLLFPEGQISCLFGPSGRGKTTILRRLEQPDSGTVDGVGDRRVSVIFQEDRLLPFCTAEMNVSVAAPGVDARLWLEKVGLADDAGKYPTQLSGGMCRRVALARALAYDGAVFLMDEPLSNLDAKLRVSLRSELKRLQKNLGITTLYVTHDQEEALTMSDTIVVMNRGDIQQIGTPTDIYNEPVNAFVADFIGESNILPGIMRRDRLVHFCGHDFACVDEGFGEDRPVDVVIRPEDLKITPDSEAQLIGTVESIVFKGVHYEMMVRTEHFTFTVHSTLCEPAGKTVGLSVIPYDIHIMHKSVPAAQKMEAAN